MNVFNYATLGLHEPWAIAPEYAQSFLPLIAQILKGESPETKQDYSAERLKNKSYFVSADADGFDEEDFVTPQDEAPAGAIAVLSLNGPVMKNSQFCGPRGTVELATELKKIYANPNFIGVLLKVETGGGQAYAIKYLTDVMEQRNKPVLVLAGNYLCSAGFYIAAYADEIVCDHPRSIIGCIGTMQSIINTQPALEKMGVEFHNINASQSTLKNKTYTETLKGNYSKLRADILDPLAGDFISDVKTQRPGIADDKTIFQGETFMASVAKDLGMVDHIGDMDFAISRLKSLAINFQAPKTQIPNSDMKNLTNVLSLAGVAIPTEEQLNQANADLTTAGITDVTLVAQSSITEAAEAATQLVEITAAHETVTADLASANEAVTTAEAATMTEANAHTATKSLLVAAQARIAKGPGAKHAGAGAEKDADIETDDDQDPEKVIAGLSHNKAAMALLG